MQRYILVRLCIVRHSGFELLAIMMSFNVSIFHLIPMLSVKGKCMEVKQLCSYATP